MSQLRAISPASLKVLYDANPGIPVIDVRTPAEYQEIHAPFAELIPLDTLDSKRLAERLTAGGHETVYIFCGTGVRATVAGKAIASQSHHPVHVVEGGMRAWEASGLPVVRGRKTISLERQVRIAAGSLVLLGVGLGSLVHPSLFGVSAFVGGGLVFAGVTDTCGMALLLARMPWNQTGAQQSARADTPR